MNPNQFSILSSLSPFSCKKETAICKRIPGGIYEKDIESNVDKSGLKG